MTWLRNFKLFESTNIWTLMRHVVFLVTKSGKEFCGYLPTYSLMFAYYTNIWADLGSFCVGMQWTCLFHPLFAAIVRKGQPAEMTWAVRYSKHLQALWGINAHITYIHTRCVIIYSIGRVFYYYGSRIDK